jgi:HAD superfamily hydrolase (TIGR01509 family)
VARTVACLVDVYETLLHYDFAGHTRRLAALAGTDVETWERAQLSLLPEFDSGRLTMPGAITRILTECGITPREDLIAELAAADVDYLAAGGGLYDDAVPFLQQVRSMGIKIALVSNCGADTRPLLDRLDVFPLTDEAILSCEVGHAKPSREIYTRALDALGVTAQDAVFVDDQPSYCEGALAVGIRPIQIAREGQPPDPRYEQVRTLADVPPLLLSGAFSNSRKTFIPNASQHLRLLTGLLTLSLPDLSRTCV